MSILRAFLLIAVASTTVVAQGRGRGGDKGPPPKQAPAKAAKPSVRTTYTTHDRDSDSRVIVTWYRDHPAERRGPGRGNGGLPPGYEKKLVRSAPVPVEYRQYVVPAPVVLVQTLPPVRPGWEFVLIENRVLLIDRPSWLIIDIVVTF
jgi:hypothetical protein